MKCDCGHDSVEFSVVRRDGKWTSICEDCRGTVRRTAKALEHPMLGKPDFMKKTSWPPPPDGYKSGEIKESNL